jgi:hypothetical protein
MSVHHEYHRRVAYQLEKYFASRQLDLELHRYLVGTIFTVYEFKTAPGFLEKKLLRSLVDARRQMNFFELHFAGNLGDVAGIKLQVLDQWVGKYNDR